MLQAALMAAPYVLNTLGGIFGKKKKYLDPEMMRQKYGPAAVARDTQAISNFILNSPYGQQLLAQAAESGQQFQNDMAARAAASGLSPDTGASSGASTFATSAAGQAQTGMERNVKAGIWQAAMPIAAAQQQQWMGLEQANLAGQNAEPSTFQKIAAAAGQMASTAAPNVQKTTTTGLPEATLQQEAQAAQGYTPTLTLRKIRKPGEMEAR